MKTYIAIDLKSFYASVECVERGYDPLNTNLVVADDSRTEKTICLAVSPALKSFGVPGRPRLYEVVQKVKEINRNRAIRYHRDLIEESIYMDELNNDPSKKLAYVVARPRMNFYMEYSTKIFGIYMKYISAEDMHVYSIDEVFIDATSYLKTYKMTARELAMKMVREVLEETGITATVGIGTNLFLAKVAMDVEAKHMEADKDGVRIAELDEETFRRNLWNHTPLTDFWRIGKGLTKRLNEMGLYTMGDIAEYSLKHEDRLFKEFGVNAELIIDHAWGYEPVEIKDIKAYKPESKSLGVGQVLSRPYKYEETKIVLKEMVESLSLDLVKQGYVSDQIVLTINYDVENIREKIDISDMETKQDFYGRTAPKPAHGTIHLEYKTSSTVMLKKKTMELFERIIEKGLTVRKINVTFSELEKEENYKPVSLYQEFDLFTDAVAESKKKEKEYEDTKKEKKLQKAIISIKDKYGKNALLKGTDFEDAATQRERNKFIGGHRG